jgi:hypothetical protein
MSEGGSMTRGDFLRLFQETLDLVALNAEAKLGKSISRPNWRIRDVRAPPDGYLRVLRLEPAS